MNKASFDRFVPGVKPGGLIVMNSSLIEHKPSRDDVDVVREGADVVGGELWEEGLVEGLAQTAAVLNAFDEQKHEKRSHKGMLVGVRKFLVSRRARVGETVRFRVDLVRRITPLTLMRGEARSGDELLASGQLKFYVEVEA